MWCRGLKEFLSLIISIIILLVIFELFCADMKIAKFIRFAFSTVMAFMMATYVIELVEKLSTEREPFIEMEQENDLLITSQINNLEKIIATRIKLEHNILCEVKISYSTSESGVVYDLIEVYASGETELIKGSIEKLVREYLDCSVVVYV